MSTQSPLPSSQPLEENPHYTFKDGRYAFFAYGRELTSELPAIAILFDHQHRAIINHGNPEFVRERFAVVQRMYIQSGLASDDVVMLEGHFAIDDLNAAISMPGRVGDLYAKVQSAHAERADEVVQALMSRMSRHSSFASNR